ncbi:MAG: biofilm PGA synthesis protein PgaB [Bacteroidales bacterium]|nr:biofilm PGA synthesis protein PgaB [Bacteroidales bacterium]
MRKISIIFIFLFTTLISCQQDKKKDLDIQDQIKVGVFDKYGICPYCIIDVVESLKIDAQIDVSTISAADIELGILDNIDVFIFPGGSGRVEMANLGDQAQQRVIDFVKKQGKGVIGICAGAYVLTETPNYPCLSLSAAEAIDIEHDNRGHGLVEFSLTEIGENYFPELKGRGVLHSQYYEGPVLIPAIDSKYQYTELATMISDVHTVKGAPKGMTVNKPFIILTNIEKGKTISVVGHPESTAGMRWMIPRLVRIITEKELISYPNQVVRPEIYSHEILFTQAQLLKQKEEKGKLLGTKEEKMEAMQEIVDMSAWLAKRWVPPMIRDQDFEVRLLAAQLIVFLERTETIPDMIAAVKNESNSKNKELLHEQLDLLLAIHAK